MVASPVHEADRGIKSGRQNGIIGCLDTAHDSNCKFLLPRASYEKSWTHGTPLKTDIRLPINHSKCEHMAIADSNQAPDLLDDLVFAGRSYIAGGELMI